MSLPSGSQGSREPWNFVQHFSYLFKHLKWGEVKVHDLIKSIPWEVSAFEEHPYQKNGMRSGDWSAVKAVGVLISL